MRRWIPLALLLFATAVHADEGMWRPRQLPDLRGELRALGTEIDPAKFADLLGHPMGAVIKIPGCTASFVSPDGLIVTNHHCVFSTLQHLSDEAHNYVRDGFLARSRDKELPARPGTYALVAVEVRDVTRDVLAAIPGGARGKARHDAVESMEKKLVADCEKEDGFRCSFVAYNGGLEYELVKQLELRDVRLVYSPARSVGEYGGDVDNWMWPRHTGDFSFYRAYAAPSGEAADYSESNVPYHPKHWLKVSAEGVKEGGLVMVAGYPGGTSRYRLADEVEDEFEWSYPAFKREFDAWISDIEKAIAGDEALAIKYSSLLNGLNNSAKNYGGMLDGYARGGTLAKKRTMERELQSWIEASPERRLRYGPAIETLRELVARKRANRERELYYDYLAHRAELLRAASRLYRLAVEKGKPDMERNPEYQERNWKRIAQGLQRTARSYDPRVDRVYYRRFVLDYAAEVPAELHAPAFDEWFGIAGNRVDEARLEARLDEMYAQTKLGEATALMGWMEKDRAAFEASRDPFIELAVRLFPHDLAIEESDEDLDGLFDEARPRYMEAVIAFHAARGESVYPDANGTLRVTYGTVKGYAPRDAVAYLPFTTLDGLLQKETGEWPFNTPASELALIRKGATGPFVDPAIGSVPVNFLSTVDSTGGNSGSATLNAKGELVGLLFDGVWESIIADWDFNLEVNRAIHLDSRYMLWVMDQVDGAHELMRELGARPSGAAGMSAAAAGAQAP